MRRCVRQNTIIYQAAASQVYVRQPRRPGRAKPAIANGPLAPVCAKKKARPPEAGAGLKKPRKIYDRLNSFCGQRTLQEQSQHEQLKPLPGVEGFPSDQQSAERDQSDATGE